MSLAIPSNFANVVAPFVPVGRQPVGQEAEDLRGSTLKPLEQLPEAARRENRRSPEDKPNETAERLRLAGADPSPREGVQEMEGGGEGAGDAHLSAPVEFEQEGRLAAQSSPMALYRQLSADATGDSGPVGSRLDRHI